MGFHFFTLLANWLKLVCLNFPFAFFTQLFFIQPFVRTVFRTVFKRDIEAREQSFGKPAAEVLAFEEEQQSEADVIADVMRLADQIKEKLAAQYK